MKSFFAALMILSSLSAFARGITVDQNTVALNIGEMKTKSVIMTVPYPGLRVCGLSLGAYGANQAEMEAVAKVLSAQEMTIDNQAGAKIDLQVGENIKINLTQFSGGYLTFIALSTTNGQTLKEVAQLSRGLILTPVLCPPAN